MKTLKDIKKIIIEEANRIDEAGSFYMEKQDLKEIAGLLKKIEDGIDDIVKFVRYTDGFIGKLISYLDHTDDDSTKKLIQNMVKEKQQEIKALGSKVTNASDAIDKMFGSGTGNHVSGMYQTLERIKKGL